MYLRTAPLLTEFGGVSLKREIFSYHLPDDCIAQHPADRRDGSRLLFLDAGNGERRDHRFSEITGLLRCGDCLVFNDTRVLPARLHGKKATGGKAEILIERIIAGQRVLAQIKASKVPRSGTVLYFGKGYQAHVGERQHDLFELDFGTGRDVLEMLADIGQVPLPPYIRRSPDSTDRVRYQTVFARHDGAVAAPTAALHFDECLLEQLDIMGVKRCFLTLHVGAGTFQPGREEVIEKHRMHSEFAIVPQSTCDQINRVRARGGRIIAVGTTVVRALETASAPGYLQAYAGETDIFIYPGYTFNMVDCLLTNFHVPESTLLMLVCAFAGRRRVLDTYAGWTWLIL